MSIQEVTPFSGGNGTNDENGQDFLRAYERAMAKESDEHKLGQFRNYLRPQSIADNWYEDINKGVQTSWKELRKAFSERWLSEETSPAQILEKTKAEYEREILETKLTVEMLGKKRLVEGREVNTHVAWADEMERLVLEAKLVNGTMYIKQVREGLPEIIRDRLAEEYESWTEFLADVRGWKP